MALAAKEGRGPTSGGMMGMSLTDLKHYAGTKEKGLPKRKGVKSGSGQGNRTKGKTGKGGKKRRP